MSEEIKQQDSNDITTWTEAVLPRTLGIRPLKWTKEGGNEHMELAGVYGGRGGSVWCATFADHQEAQAWIIASNQFGQPVRGVPDAKVNIFEAFDGPRVQG